MHTTPTTHPAMDPDTSEATQPQLDRAVAQGDAYRAAAEYMARPTPTSRSSSPTAPTVASCPASRSP